MNFKIIIKCIACFMYIYIISLFRTQEYTNNIEMINQLPFIRKCTLHTKVRIIQRFANRRLCCNNVIDIDCVRDNNK